MQAVMPLASASAEHVGGNPFTIVPNANPEIFLVVANFNFNVFCRCVSEGIAYCLRRKPVNFVSKNRMQIPRYTLHDHFKLGRRLIVLSRSEFFPNRSNGYGERSEERRVGKE